MAPLPYVDEHARTLRVGVNPAFDAAAAQARALAGRRPPRLFVRAWGTRPESGFAVWSMLRNIARRAAS